ncbi:MAG: PAS domain S-box protein [Syntrophomonas sp.]
MESNQKFPSHQFNRYKYIIENIKDVIWEMNKDYVFTFVSPNAKDMAGYSAEELVGKKMPDFLSEESQNYTFRLAKEHLNMRINGDTEEMILHDVQFICKNGKVKWVEISAQPMFEDGRFTGYIGTTRDITEKKKYERRSLRLYQELFYKAYNANPLDMFIVSMQNGTIMEVNDTVLKRCKRTREELIGARITDSGIWVEPSERDKYIELIKKEGLAENFEMNFCKNSGEVGTMLLSGVIISWQGEECVLSIANNITELRRYQHEMVHLDRLNLIGEMAASIAHEIRNPMSTVKGFLELFKSQERYTADREYIDLMIEEMERANVIITEFLSLAKDKVVALKLENLNEKIKILLPVLLARALKDDINIKLELGDIPELMMDKDEIRQLILNLVINGIDSMSTAGCLTIKTFKDIEGITLAIQDQGKGISPEVLEKIGNPFFTTKENGTGLGLAVCYSIANRHNAKINIETGQAGTIFKVIFPISREDSTSTLINR